MARPDKAAGVAELVESFQESAGAVLTEYRGLTVKQLQELRRSLGDNADYAVVKNTLTKIAATEAGVDGFDDLLTGPTAIAFINGDVVEAAKGLRDFARANPALVIKGGVLEGKTLDAAEVARLADLESREVLLGRLAGGMLASLSQAVYLLNAPVAQVARLAGALQAKAEEDPSVLGGGAGEPAAAAESPTADGSGDAGTSAAADGAPDAGSADVVSADAVSTDAVSTDAGSDADVTTETATTEVPAETSTTETGASETGTSGTGTSETGTTDTGTTDATADAGTTEA